MRTKACCALVLVMVSAVCVGLAAQETGGTAYQASIQIDASSPIKEISPLLYGFGLQFTNHGDGLWDPQANDFNPKALERVKELGPKLLRYPSGSLTDKFHWKEAVGKDRKPQRSLEPEGSAGAYQDIDFGVDEFLKLCEAVRAEPLIQPNERHGTAEEAAEWVAYCNDPENQLRIDNGRMFPLRVKYWEIGNETYLEDPAKEPEAKPEAYAARVKEFAKAMRAVDPSIVIGATGSDYSQLEWGLGQKGWNEAVLKNCGEDIDFFALHTAYYLVMHKPNTENWTDKDIVEMLLATPLLIQQNLALTDRQIRENVPEPAASKMKLAMTEWSTFFGIPNAEYDILSNTWAERCSSLAGALYEADCLRVFMHDPRMFMAAYWSLIGNWEFGAIWHNLNRNPIYHIFDVYIDHFGTKLLPAEVDAPTYNPDHRMGWAVEIKDVPYLTANAALSEDGQRLTVAVINKNVEQDADVTLEIAGFASASEGTAWTVTGPSFLSMNKEDESTVPLVESKVTGIGEGFRYTFPKHSFTMLEFRR